MLAAPAQPPSTPTPARPRPVAAGGDASPPAGGFAILLAGLLPPPATSEAPPATAAGVVGEIDGASAPAGAAPATTPKSASPLRVGAPGPFAAVAARVVGTTTPTAVASAPVAPLPAAGQGDSAEATPMVESTPQPQPVSWRAPAGPVLPAPLPSPAAAPPIGASTPATASIPAAAPDALPVGTAVAVTAPLVAPPSVVEGGSPSQLPSATVPIAKPAGVELAADATDKPRLAANARASDQAGSGIPTTVAQTIVSESADLEAPPAEDAPGAPVTNAASKVRPGSTAAARPGPQAPATSMPHPATTPGPQGPAPNDRPVVPSSELAAVAPIRSEAAPGAPAAPPHPASAPAPAAQPVVQLAVQIAAAVPRRIERLFVQLDPPALGRVEVRLEFSRDNRVSAAIAADRHDTLDVLQRDSRGLERALTDAGLRLGDNGLSFSLRQEQRQERRGAWAPSAPLRIEPVDGPSAAPPSEPLQPLRWVGVHRVLDIRI